MAHDFQDMDGEPGDFTVSEGHEHPLISYNLIATKEMLSMGKLVIINYSTNNCYNN